MCDQLVIHRRFSDAHRIPSSLLLFMTLSTPVRYRHVTNTSGTGLCAASFCQSAHVTNRIRNRFAAHDRQENDAKLTRNTHENRKVRDNNCTAQQFRAHDLPDSPRRIFGCSQIVRFGAFVQLKAHPAGTKFKTHRI